MARYFYVIFAGLLVNVVFYSITIAQSEDTLRSNNFRKYDISFYFLDLEVTDTSTYLSGSTSILAKIVDINPDTVILDLTDSLSVDSVMVNDSISGYVHHNDLLHIDIPFNIQTEDLIELKIYYHGYGQEGWLGGMVNSLNRYDSYYTWTLSEPYSAKLWFPCKQDLNDKADSANIFLTVPSGLKAGSNGILTNIIDLHNGKIRYEWKTRYPIAYYLISLAVGDYYEYNIYAKLPDRNDSLLIQNYLYNDEDYIENNQERIDITDDLIILYSELFGEYPYADEKYGHSTTPFGGGMEHQTMSTMGMYNFQIISHELAHQWFGDLVTCKTWQDIWINEGFASYAEYLALEHIYSRDAANDDMGDVQEYAMSSPRGSVYVPYEELDDVWRIFSGRLSYKKGSAIIHMIRHELDDDELFLEVLREFLFRYKNGTASINDFREVLEQISGIDFNSFFDQWIYGEGYPVFDITWQQTGDSLKITSDQTTTASDITTIFNTKMDFKVNFHNGSDTTLNFRQETNHQEYVAIFPERISTVEFDPQKWLLKEVNSYQKILPDELLKNMIILYPSITDTSFLVEILDTLIGCEYKIVKNNGSISKSGKLNSTYMEFDVSGYEAGVYFFIVNVNDITIKKKITVL